MTRRSLLIGVMGATGALATIAAAQKQNTSQQEDKFTVANQHVKELLLLMDADNNGRISKHEWMSFMEAEFNRLDTDGSGELDPKELSQTRLSARSS
jgi:Ca2+-binding EF-hand superfamily protein